MVWTYAIKKQIHNYVKLDMKCMVESALGESEEWKVSSVSPVEPNMKLTLRKYLQSS